MYCVSIAHIVNCFGLSWTRAVHHLLKTALLLSLNCFVMLCIFLQWREEMDFYLTGCQRRFRIGCKRRREFGYSYVPGVLTFQTEDGVEFHILRFFSVRIVSDLYDDLKQTSEYKPPQRATEIPRDVKTFGGIPLPRYSMAFSALLTFQLSVFVIVLFHHPSALVHGIPEEVSLKYFNSLKKLVWVWKKIPLRHRYHLP